MHDALRVESSSPNSPAISTMRPDYDIMINGISNQTPGLSSIIILQHSDAALPRHLVVCTSEYVDDGRDPLHLGSVPLLRTDACRVAMARRRAWVWVRARTVPESSCTVPLPIGNCDNTTRAGRWAASGMRRGKPLKI